MTEQKITREYLNTYRIDVSWYARHCGRAHLNPETYEPHRRERIKQIKIEAAKKMKQLKPYILFKQASIKKQISKIPKIHFREMLTMRYIYQYKWTKIIDKFMAQEQRLEDEEYMYEGYRDKIFYWHKQALKSLEKAQETGV